MILIPCALYFYLAHPAWSWLYLVNPSRVPRVAVVTIVAAWGAAVIGAYYGGAWLLRNGKERVLLGAIAVGFALIVLLVILLRHRLLHYGSYEDFARGRALALAQVKLGYVLIAVVIGVCAATAFVGWELRRDGRRAAAR